MTSKLLQPTPRQLLLDSKMKPRFAQLARAAREARERQLKDQNLRNWGEE